ncbi:Uncharacterised protein [Klebsiella pneumoniae]|nr:hypothetical protein PAERUG_P62_London_9_VIM_2_01_14_01513 [Pseudomonas aeruginosa]SPY62421.1 Uncharacterised protein [Pseudomonas aeruginosa]SVJ79006.1 Uncharacterised protein [Klebsiella pneumoniae]
MIGGMGGETGHAGTQRQVADAGADRQHLAGQFEAETGRQRSLLRGQVLTPEHILPAHADRLDTHQDFPCGRRRGRQLFAFEDLWRAKLMKTDHSGHRKPLQCITG